MSWRRIDVTVLVAAVVFEVATGIALGRHGLFAAIVVVVVALVAGAALQSPTPAAIFVLLVAFVLGIWLADAFVLAPGAAVIGFASAIVVRRRPAVARVVSRLTTGTQVPHPGVATWAVVLAPMATAAVLWLARRFFPPGELLGLSGSWRHLVNGLSAVALVGFEAIVVTWSTRAAGVTRSRAVVWGLTSAAMVLVWVMGIFVGLYAVSGPKGG